MGIRGLEAFIERELPHVLETVNINLCAQEYAKRMKRDPILLISGSGIFYKLYEKYPTSVSHLCLNDKLGLHVQRIISLYSDCNIKCIVYFKGSPVYYGNSFIDKRKVEATNIPRIIHTLESESPQEAYEEYVQRYLIDQELVKYFLRLSKCEIKQFEGTDDIEVAQFYSQHGIFGLLAQDTDFIITERIENYFSVKHLDESGLHTKAYRRNIFAKSLGFDERFLPIFATLCGRGYSIGEDLRQFHLHLLRDRRDVWRWQNASFIPKKLLISKIGQWIRHNSQHLKNCENISRAVAELIRLPHLETKISDSLIYYCIGQELRYRIQWSSGEDDDWSKILRTAYLLYEKKGVHRDIWNVLYHRKHFIQNNFLTVCDVPYPCCSRIAENLLRRIYGVLLKECPEASETPVVQLYCYKKDLGYGPSVLYPTFPLEHPGLLYIWGDCPINEKLTLLCWIVSDKLKPCSIFCLPEELRIASLALFYLVNEGEHKLKPWQAEAVVGHLVCLSESVDLSQYTLNPLKSLEIHISSQYMVTWTFIAMADDACGNPLGVKKKTIIFDGSIDL